MDDIVTKSVDELNPIEICTQVVKLEQAKRQLDERLKQLKNGLLEKMTQTDVLTLKTGNYTISRSLRTTPTILNHQQVKEELAIQGHQVITKEVIDMDYMKPLVMSLKPKGVEFKETSYVSIRINKKKGQ